MYIYMHRLIYMPNFIINFIFLLKIISSHHKNNLNIYFSSFEKKNLSKDIYKKIIHIFLCIQQLMTCFKVSNNIISVAMNNNK